MPGPYAALLARARELLSGERDPIANAANLAAAIFSGFSDVNWAGFYFAHGDELVLGPFQGEPAVTRIARGAGVCGRAWARGESLVVDDVRAFDGHIVCDPASASELVVPILVGGRAVGVVDIDSPRPARFGADEKAAIETIAALYVSSSDRR